MVAEQVVTSPGAAREAVRAADGRAVLKVLSPDIAHKSDLGLVRVGVSEAEAGPVYTELLELAARSAPEAELRGAVVQPLVDDAVAEAIVGLSHQPPFGPVVMVGLGGIFVEVLRDVSFGVPPFSRDWARRMVNRLKGSAAAGRGAWPPGG